MNRAIIVSLFALSCRAASAQYPIYPALPQPLTWPAYSVYQSGLYSGFTSPGYASPTFSYPAYSNGPYSFGPYGFAGVPYAGLNWLPPTLPSPYYVVPSGRQYLEQARRREQTTYSELTLQNYLQK
jgi:hypothetical protein